MFSLHYLVLRTVFASFVLITVEGIDLTFMMQAACENIISEEQCNKCYIKSKISFSNHSEGVLLINFIEQFKLNFKSNESISWRYQNIPHLNPSQVQVTLTVWDDKSNKAHPVPGCCSVSLSSGQCQLSTCVSVKNRTGFTLSYKQMNLMKSITIPKTSSCEANTARVQRTVRYFSICTEEETAWKMRYNCECAVYDSNTGHFLPGNHSTQVEKEAAEGGLWFFDSQPESYQVCVFSMTKDDVMQRGRLANDSSVMDSVAFNRGVFDMEGFSCSNGSVFDRIAGKHINCSLRYFRGSNIFSINSSDGALPEIKTNNDSFTCVVPWLNGSHGLRPVGAHVKCMPQNETFPMTSHVYTMNKKKNSFVNTMIVFVPLFGAFALLAIICFLGVTLGKKYNKFMKETKKVPEELHTVMKEYSNFFNGNTDFFTDEEKEQCQAFDGEERKFILSIRSKKGDVSSDKERNFLENDSNPRAFNNYQHFSITSNGNPIRISNHSSSDFNLPENEIEKNVKSQTSEFENDDKSSTREGNDSGCSCSISSNSIRSHKSDRSFPSLSEIPYCLHQVTNSSRHDQDKLFSRSLTSLEDDSQAIGIDQIPSGGGYWSKEPFETSSAKSRFSRCSDDTGCGSEYEENVDEMNNFVFANDPKEGKKHPFVKTTSKDSGVVNENFRTNSIGSLSDVSQEVEIKVVSTPVRLSGGSNMTAAVQ